MEMSIDHSLQSILDQANSIQKIIKNDSDEIENGMSSGFIYYDSTEHMLEYKINALRAHIRIEVDRIRQLYIRNTSDVSFCINTLEKIKNAISALPFISDESYRLAQQIIPITKAVLQAQSEGKHVYSIYSKETLSHALNEIDNGSLVIWPSSNDNTKIGSSIKMPGSTSLSLYNQLQRFCLKVPIEDIENMIGAHTRSNYEYFLQKQNLVEKDYQSACNKLYSFTKNDPTALNWVLIENNGTIDTLLVQVPGEKLPQEIALPFSSSMNLLEKIQEALNPITIVYDWKKNQESEFCVFNRLGVELKWGNTADLIINDRTPDYFVLVDPSTQKVRAYYAQEDLNGVRTHEYREFSSLESLRNQLGKLFERFQWNSYARGQEELRNQIKNLVGDTRLKVFTKGISEERPFLNNNEGYLEINVDTNFNPFIKVIFKKDEKIYSLCYHEAKDAWKFMSEKPDRLQRFLKQEQS